MIYVKIWTSLSILIATLQSLDYVEYKIQELHFSQFCRLRSSISVEVNSVPAQGLTPDTWMSPHLQMWQRGCSPTRTLIMVSLPPGVLSYGAKGPILNPVILRIKYAFWVENRYKHSNHAKTKSPLVLLPSSCIYVKIFCVDSLFLR